MACVMQLYINEPLFQKGLSLLRMVDLYNESVLKLLLFWQRMGIDSVSTFLKELRGKDPKIQNFLENHHC